MRVVALCLGTVLAGCSGSSSGSTSLPVNVASVSIDREVVRGELDARCEQFGWLLKVSTWRDSPGFTAWVDTDGKVDLRSVTVQDLGGITGSYADVTGGDGRASYRNGTLEMSGTLLGFRREMPAKMMPAHFDIRTGC